MIDTVIIRIPYEFCKISDPKLFNPNINLLGAYGRCVFEKPTGIYFPNIAMVRYLNHSTNSNNTDLVIDFSVPKLIFGNNLEETSKKDFPEVVEKLNNLLKGFGILIPNSIIASAAIKGVHFSKNIFLENTTSRMVITSLERGNLKRLKQTRRDYANHGEKLAFTSKSYEICFYDKTREMASESKRIVEGERKEIAQSIVKAIKGKQIIRMEVRLNTINKIKNLFYRYKILQKTCETKSEFFKREICFEEIFNEMVSWKVCNGYFRMIESTVNIENKNDFKGLVQHIIQDKKYKTGKCFSTIGALTVISLLGREFVSERSAKKLREVENIMLSAKKILNIDSFVLKEFGSKLEKFELIDDLIRQVFGKKSKKHHEVQPFLDDINEFGSEKLIFDDEDCSEDDDILEI